MLVHALLGMPRKRRASLPGIDAQQDPATNNQHAWRLEPEVARNLGKLINKPKP